MLEATTINLTLSNCHCLINTTHTLQMLEPLILQGLYNFTPQDLMNTEHLSSL